MEGGQRVGGGEKDERARERFIVFIDAHRVRSTPMAFCCGA